MGRNGSHVRERLALGRAGDLVEVAALEDHEDRDEAEDDSDDRDQRPSGVGGAAAELKNAISATATITTITPTMPNTLEQRTRRSCARQWAGGVEGFSTSIPRRR